MQNSWDGGLGKYEDIVNQYNLTQKGSSVGLFLRQMASHVLIPFAEKNNIKKNIRYRTERSCDLCINGLGICFPTLSLALDYESEIWTASVLHEDSLDIFPSAWALHTIPSMTCRKAVVGL